MNMWCDVTSRSTFRLSAESTQSSRFRLRMGWSTLLRWVRPTTTSSMVPPSPITPQSSCIRVMWSPFETDTSGGIIQMDPYCLRPRDEKLGLLPRVPWWRRFQWSLKTLAWWPSPRGSQSRRQTRECWAGARGLTQATKFCQILIFMQLSSSWYSVSVSESPVGLVKV